jgi:hypothetical protein
MKKFPNKDYTKQYTWADLRKAHYKVIYWVHLPQGITKHYTNGRSWWTQFLVAKTLKQANKLANKYNSPYFDRMVQCDLGRWSIKQFVKTELKSMTVDEIYDMYMKLPKIIL